MEKITLKKIEGSLSGSQKKIYQHFHELIENNIERTTGPVNFLDLSDKLDIPQTTLKKSIQRLIKKEIFRREKTKFGPGGWCEYSIPVESYIDEDLEQRKKVFKNDPSVYEVFKRMEKEKNILISKLKERNKELNCLYNFSKLTEETDLTIDDILQYLVEMIPLGMQYPEITCCQIITKDKCYQTENFKKTSWKMVKKISVNDDEFATLEVYYLKKRLKEFEGPFLKEECILVGDITNRLKRFLERKQYEEEKKIERRKLEEANITLKNILWSIEDEKEKFKEAVTLNIEKSILPIVYDLKNHSDIDFVQLELLESNLRNLTDDFHRKIINLKYDLTPTEIEICKLIKSGYAGKIIADILHISHDTVRSHRKNIRRKLHLTNSDIHLKVFLDRYC